METVIIKALSFVLIIFGATWLRHAGFFRKEDFRLISDLVLKVTLPCAVISNFSRTDVEASLLYLIPLGVLCNLVTIAAGYFATPASDRARRAFNMINLSGYNIGCFTMPYIQSFLGPSGAIATCLFDAGNSLMCTGATYPMAAAVAGTGEKSGVKVFLRRMFSSIPMDTYIIMVILSLLGRYVIAFVMALLFWYCTPFSEGIRKILLVISFAPVSAVCAIFTSKCGGDVPISCTVNSLSILISIVCMTVIMIVFRVS